MPSKAIKNTVRILSFSALFSGVVALVSYFFFRPLGPDTTAYGTFYKEKKDSLDLVMIGSSTVRDGFIPMEAYKQENITSHSIVASPTHLEVIKIAIKEAVRTQNPKVIYIDLNGLNNQTEESASTFVKDYYLSMPDDEETKKVKKELRKEYDYLVESSEWEPFKGHNSFRQQVYWESFVYNKQFYTKGYNPEKGVKEAKVSEVDPSKTLPLSEDATKYLTDILSICKEMTATYNTKFLFGQMPRYLSDTIASFDAYQIHSPLEACYYVRSAKAAVEEAGYTFLDYSSNEFLKDVIGLDPTKDQYDAEHLNHRGALKFTKYFSSYLSESVFDAPLTHSKEIEKDFDKAYKEYREIVEGIEKKLECGQYDKNKEK